MSSLDLFLLCAGKGERLRPLTDAVPKPLTTLLGKTLAERALEACAGLPVTSTLVNAHHLAPSVETFAKAHGIGHVQVEPTLLDSGGALSKAFASRKLPSPHVLAHNGDILHDIDLKAAWQAHLEGGNDVTLVMVDVPRINTVHVCDGLFAGVAGHPACPTDLDGTRALTFSGIAFYRTSLLQGWSTRAWTIKDLWHKAAFVQSLKVACWEAPAVSLWEDCGVPGDLARAGFLLLEREGKEQWIDPTAKVSVDAVLAGRVVVEAGGWIEAGAHVEDVLLQPDSRVKAGESVRRTVRNAGGDAIW